MAKSKNPRPAPVPVPDVPLSVPGNAPPAPPGFAALTKPQVDLLRKPTAAQVANGAAVAAEVKSKATYKADFGDKALAQDQLVALLSNASAWSTEAARAVAWAEYAKTIAQLAWHDMLSANEQFQGDFENALAHDGGLAQAYPSLTAFEGARSDAAKRGAETKKTKKKNQGPPKG